MRGAAAVRPESAVRPEPAVARHPRPRRGRDVQRRRVFVSGLRNVRARDDHAEKKVRRSLIYSKSSAQWHNLRVESVLTENNNI